MVWTARSKIESDILRELENESDRAAAIIAATILEDRLTIALQSTMRRDAKLIRDLFEIDGALAAFGTKANIGFLIGLFNRNTFSDITVIRGIRNDFAHKLEYKDFKSQSIAGRGVA
jgi:hypothetical protein